jgi:hypothetical protein
MNKKTAFIAVARLSQKMGFIREFNATNVHHVVSGLKVATD